MKVIYDREKRKIILKGENLEYTICENSSDFKASQLLAFLVDYPKEGVQVDESTYEGIDNSEIIAEKCVFLKELCDSFFKGYYKSDK